MKISLRRNSYKHATEQSSLDMGIISCYFKACIHLLKPAKILEIHEREFDIVFIVTIQRICIELLIIRHDSSTTLNTKYKFHFCIYILHRFVKS